MTPSGGNCRASTAKNPVKCVAGDLPSFLFSARPPVPSILVPVVCAVHKSRGILRGLKRFCLTSLGSSGVSLLMWKFNLSKLLREQVWRALPGEMRVLRWPTVADVSAFVWGFDHDRRCPGPYVREHLRLRRPAGTFRSGVPNVVPSLGWFWPLDQGDNLTGLWLHRCDLTTIPLVSAPVCGTPNKPC